MISDIQTGAATVARGLQILKRPEIRIYAIMPLLVNIVLFGGLIWYGYAQFQPLVEYLMSYLPGFLDFLRWFLWILITVLTALIVFFSFTPIANIVAAPFNALMSETIEILLTGKTIGTNGSFIAMALNSIRSQLRKLGYILLWSGALFLISLIPLLNIIAPVLWVVFGSWLLTLEYLDYPMGNHDLSFSRQKQILGQRKGLALGFGGCIMVLTVVPLLNFIVMPVAVAGATVLWVEQLATTGQTET